jgi:GTP-binding protein
MTAKPLVAIVGRPNVGKSTLFNRIIGQRLAIVDDRPGTTRDRLYADAEWNGVEFALVDTGGLDFVKVNPQERHGSELRHEYNPRQIQQLVSQQAQVAIAEADVIILVVSITDGVMAGDLDVAEQLRRSGKPIILATNKADNLRRELDAMEFYQLGLDEPFNISALHGNGTGDLLDKVVAALPKQAPIAEDGSLKVAIVGRPNVGKSSLLNALIGQERAIVSDIPGTTRDTLDTRLSWDGHPVTLIDTAGIRRRGHIAHGEVEQYSVLRAMRAIQRCDVALLVVDGVDGITAQDAHVASYILDEGKGAVIVVNKWDLVEKESDTLAIYEKQIQKVMDFMTWAPLVFVSAKTKRRIHTVMEAALRAHEGRKLRVPTGELNELVRDATARHAPPSKHGKRLRFFYATQPSIEPPTFVFFVSDTELVHFSYQRYLENLIREQWGFEGTPIRLNFRRKEKDAA